MVAMTAKLNMAKSRHVEKNNAWFKVLHHAPQQLQLPT